MERDRNRTLNVIELVILAAVAIGAIVAWAQADQPPAHHGGHLYSNGNEVAVYSIDATGNVLTVTWPEGWTTFGQNESNEDDPRFYTGLTNYYNASSFVVFVCMFCDIEGHCTQWWWGEYVSDSETLIGPPFRLLTSGTAD